MSYTLGPVKPHVRAAAREVGRRYNITTIHGWGQRANVTDHDDGLALDFMTRDGQRLADYVRANARRLAVTYIIWDRRIWSAARNGEGWRPMPDRGSDTANHRDHVHVSFAGTAPAAGDSPFTPTYPATNDDTTNPAELAQGAQRVAMYAAAVGLGALLIVLGAAATAKGNAHAATEPIRKALT